MPRGIAASPGIAIGEAVEQTKKQTIQLQEKVKKKVGEREAYIFKAYLSILEDPLLIDETIKRIKRERLNAEAALRLTYKSFPERFGMSQPEFFEERFRDVEDVGERILRNLLKQPSLSLSHLEEKIIIVAHDLAPSDTVSMDKSKVLGFATNIDITRKVKPGSTLILDGSRGRVIVNPSHEQIRKYGAEQKRFLIYKKKLETLRSLPAQTVDRREVELAANIAGPEEVDLAIKEGAEGVGLYRTEYLYMNRAIIPS